MKRNFLIGLAILTMIACIALFGCGDDNIIITPTAVPTTTAPTATPTTPAPGPTETPVPAGNTLTVTLSTDGLTGAVDAINTVDLVTRDASETTVVAPGTGNTVNLAGVTEGWYFLRVNNIDDYGNAAGDGDLIPVYIDPTKDVYVIVSADLTRAVLREDAQAEDDALSMNNQGYVRTYGNNTLIKKFTDDSDATPASQAFFAIDIQERIFIVGRMLDGELVLESPQFPEASTHDELVGWLLDGHKQAPTCAGCHPDANVKPGAYPDTFDAFNTDGICFLCHAGGSGSNNGYYNTSQ